jgi:branched-chain amino acid aminotransferase
MIVAHSMIKVTRTQSSRRAELDFDNLKFGREFTDHMFEINFKDGAWETPEIVPFASLKMHPASSVLHYGQSIFEGLKAYKNEQGEVYLFRPEMNVARLNESAKRMCMPTIDPQLLLQAMTELVALDKDWIPSSEGGSLYLRPFMIATDEYVGVKPSESYKLVIFMCPVNAYYAGAVKVKIETKYSRSVIGGTGYAKAAGNYAAALYPAKLAQEKGYDQLVWTDALEHKWIEESGTMNIVFRSGNTIFCPKPSETILDGITRQSVLQIAEDWGYTVEQRKVSVTEIRELLEKGELHEAFGAGTAATIAPIALVGFEDRDFELEPHDTWEFAPKALAHIERLKRGLEPDIHSWNVRID